MQQTWVGFKTIILNEKSQTQIPAHYMVQFIWHSIKGKMIGILWKSL